MPHPTPDPRNLGYVRLIGLAILATTAMTLGFVAAVKLGYVPLGIDPTFMLAAEAPFMALGILLSVAPERFVKFFGR